MSVQDSSMYKEIIVNEKFYVVLQERKMLRAPGTNDRLIWSSMEYAKSYIKDHDIQTYDKILELDIDRFVTYEMNDILKEEDYLILDPVANHEGVKAHAISFFNEAIKELDDIRIKEFAEDVCNNGHVYGLTMKGESQFIIVSEANDIYPEMMTFWSTKKAVETVRNDDFDKYDIIEIETNVLEDWLDDLADEHIAVGLNLKPGMIGTITEPKFVLNTMPC